MKKLCYLIITILLALGLAACSATQDKNTGNNKPTKPANNKAGALTPTTAAPTLTQVSTSESQNVTETVAGTVETKKIKSKAIAKNIIGDKATRTIYIYLPPSYKSSDKSYPVVYFLHGYGDSCKAFMDSYHTKLDNQFNNGAKEFILVALDGNNKTGGSFYVNSPVMGNWEDFVVKEVVAYMDKNYRTIADSASRGISGYSMGGFGALYLALRHPGVFSSSMVFCPGVFAEDDLDSVMASWSGWTDVKQSYAQAFSPDKKNTKDYGNILKDSDISSKNKVWKDWMNGYSNWGSKLDDYLALKKPLKSIMINYSLDDQFKWIPGGCEYLAHLLKEKKMTYSIRKFDGGHIVPPDAIENFFVPFFGDNLSY